MLYEVITYEGLLEPELRITEVSVENGTLVILLEIEAALSDPCSTGSGPRGISTTRRCFAR